MSVDVEVRQEAGQVAFEPTSRAWVVLGDVGWHPGAALAGEDRARYQPLWLLADEAGEAEERAARLGRRAARRGFVAGLLAAAAAVLSAVAGLGNVGTVIGAQPAGWIALAAAAAASGSGAMQGVSRGVGTLRVEQRAWEQYADVIADDVATMAADPALDSTGRARWAAARLAQARREAPDYLARRPSTSGL